MVGLITNNDKTAYREDVRALNNLSLNVNKTKDMIVDVRKQQMEHPPIHIDRTAVEKVESFKFLIVHITDKLKWSTHTESVVLKVQKRGLSPDKPLQMHNGEHPVGLYHRLVRQLRRPQPQGSPEGSEVCPTHHRRKTTCPPGHQHHVI